MTRNFLILQIIFALCSLRFFKGSKTTVVGILSITFMTLNECSYVIYGITVVNYFQDATIIGNKLFLTFIDYNKIVGYYVAELTN